MASDDRLVLIEPVDELLVDDRNAFAARAIRVGQITPGAHMQPQRLKIARRDVGDVRDRRAFNVRAAIERPDTEIEQARVRQAERHACRLDPRNRADARERVREQSIDLRGLFVPRILQRDRRRHDVRRIESRTQGVQMNEGPHQETRADEQYDAHRHFTDDEQLPGPSTRPAGDAACAGFGKRGLHVDAARMERRHQAEDDAGSQRTHDRCDENPRVERDRVVERQHIRRERPHTVENQPAEPKAEKSAGQGQHGTLDQQLPNHRWAAAAEGHARRNLPRAHAGPREQETGDVDARDQQHETDRSPQHQERLTHIGRLLLLLRQQRTDDGGVGRGLSFRGLGAKLRDLRIGLRPRHARADARQHLIVAAAAFAASGRPKRRPQIHLASHESGGHDADDRVLLSAQHDGTAHDCSSRSRTVGSITRG